MTSDPPFNSMDQNTFDENTGSAMIGDDISMGGSGGEKSVTTRIQTGGDDRGGKSGDVGACFGDTMTTPSTARRGKLAVGSAYRRNMSTSGTVGNDENVPNVSCKVVTDKKCEIHGCPAKKIKLKTQKWRWTEKRKSYGYVNVQYMKVVCSYQEGIPVEPDVSTPTRDLARGLGSVGVGIRALEEFCSNRITLENESSGLSG